MPKITKKSIFEDRLKGNPICIHLGETSKQELQVLLDAKVLRIDREAHGNGIAIAMCEIKSGNKVKNGDHGILYRYFTISPDELVRY